MPAPETLDDVLAGLTTIVDEARAAPSRVGYFAALYRKVTARVKERVDAGGFFDDDARMERLDVVFARRYLDALAARRAGHPTTRCWTLAFDATDDWWPIVLQHLLLGMNAHINLDLGIAAVETVGARGLPALRADFDRINALLFELVGEVEAGLTWVWPPLRLATRGLGRVDDALIRFSMTRARDAAWDFAEELAPLDATARARRVVAQDVAMAHLGQLVRRPGLLLGSAAHLVRLGERGGVRRIVDALA